MRGRRAFVILTIYLLLLGGFALMVERIMEAIFQNPFAGDIGDGQPGDRPGHLRGAADADDPAGRLPGAVIDGRRDLARAREADPRTARHDADQLARDRRRQAAVGARLRLPADRRVDPVDGRRLRVRWCRARGRRPRLHRADRHRARAGLVRSALLQHRQAHDGIDRDHDLRRPRDHDRDGLPAGLLAGDGLVRREREPAAGSARHPHALRRSPGSTRSSPRPTCCAAPSPRSAAAGAASSTASCPTTTTASSSTTGGGGVPHAAARCRRVPEKGFAGAGGAIVIDDGGRPRVRPQRRRRTRPAVRRSSATPCGPRPWRCGSACRSFFLLLSVQAVSPTRRWRSCAAASSPAEPGAMTLGFRPSRAGRRAGATPARAARRCRPTRAGRCRGPLDPSLEAIRGDLARVIGAGCGCAGSCAATWLALAAIAIGEAVLWTVARFVPLEAAPIIAAADPDRGRPGPARRRRFAHARRSARPRWPSTSKAALATASRRRWSWRSAIPASATPPAEDLDLDASVAAVDEAAETDRFVRRQRRDALATLRTAPACSSRGSRGTRRSPPGGGRPARAGPRPAEPAVRRHRPAARCPRGRRAPGRSA